MGEQEFDAAWAEGAAMSTEEAIAYARRGRGERKRPASGWQALTPTELDVVRLVAEGLPNKDIATRLFVSPRTVQTHLTHVYTKLGLILPRSARAGSRPPQLNAACALQLRRHHRVGGAAVGALPEHTSTGSHSRGD